jgi:tetratricopeptide (TPR) repeat protein
VYAEFTASGKRRFYLLALSFFILGVLSKPMIVSLPVIMLLLDFWPLKRVGRDNADRTPDSARIRSVIQEKIPFFTISLLSCVVTVYAQMKGGAVANLAELPFLVRFQNAMVSYLRYIGKTFWPHDLAVFYPYPAAVPAWQFYGSLGLLLLVSGAVWVGRRHRYLVTGWLWFLITLLPVIGLVQVGNQAMADRYAYLPIIGLFIMVAWGIPDILHGGRWAKRMAATSAVIIVVVSSAATWRQIGYWRDSITLFRHTLQVTHNNAFIHYNLGLTLHRNGDIDEAIIEYGKTLAITPDDKDARNALGLALYGKGRLNEAQREYARALQLAPNDASTHNNLGVLYGTLGNLDAAIREFRAALLLDSSSVDAADNLTRAIVAKRARDN